MNNVEQLSEKQHDIHREMQALIDHQSSLISQQGSYITMLENFVDRLKEIVKEQDNRIKKLISVT